MISNRPAHGLTVPFVDPDGRWRRLLAMPLIIVLSFTVLMFAGLSSATANADEGTAVAASTDSKDGKDDDSKSSDSKKPIISIDRSTPVVTDTTGYSVTVTVSNPTSTDLPKGSLAVAYNPVYTFVSRTDMQHWSEGGVDIPVRTVLGQVDVPAIKAGGSARTTVTASAATDAMKALQSWGPKPLMITYSPGVDAAGNSTNSNDTAPSDVQPVSIHSFLTRSTQGINTAATPPMNITLVMPLTDTERTTDTSAIDRLVSHSNNNTGSNNTAQSVIASGTATDATQSQDRSQTNKTASAAGGTNSATANANADNTSADTSVDTSTSVTAKLSVAAEHRTLQVIADPTSLSESQSGSQSADSQTGIAAVMQPANFDITAYAAINRPQSYSQAGISNATWTAKAALDDTNQTGTTVAWQGEADWTTQALTTAKRQGYGIVIAAHDFDTNDTATVHTGKYVVSTQAGDVTVLAEQEELGNLAKGKPTSDSADGETTNAGRIARFVAQSAFYQMEQPYSAQNRNLLVCFSPTASAGMIDQLTTAVEQSTWLRAGSLDNLINAETYQSGDTAAQIVPTSDHLSDKRRQRIAKALESLKTSRADINRFADTILVDRSSAKTWVDTLLNAHSALAMNALSATAGAKDSATFISGAKRLGAGMFNGVTIKPTEPVTVVSETAKMPITISNSHPYAVRVQVSSLTDSMEIVTERLNEVTVPANGETQVTFAIRVATSGKAVAHITLQDNDGLQFGTAQDTSITSVLRISDKTGFVIIGLSIVLGLLGLWRQFHRKKDPDE